MAWVFLLVAGLLETVWAASMKLSAGFTKPGPAVVTLVAAAGSFWLLGLAMRGLPLGTAYAVWVGIGALGSVAFGALVLGEGVNALRLVSVGLILAGIVGLYLSQEGGA